MAGGFEPIDPERCEHYAVFASHLDRRSFDFIYWFLFVGVIGMLFLASWRYSGDLDKVRMQGHEPGSRGYKHRMMRCMMVCGVYACISIVAVVMEVYALLALQFCDGEDLMSLFWSTWAMMQVGSLIAILGILLSVLNSLRGNQNPPWALALGTPVLVVAGIGHAVHGAMRKRVQKVRSRSRGRQRGMSDSSSSRRLDPGDLPISREQTLRADESEKEEAEIPATFLGFTPQGSPIVKFAEDLGGSIDPEQGIVLGRSDGHVIIAFRKAMTVANDSNDSICKNNDDNSRLSPASAAEPPVISKPGPSTASRPPPVVRIASPPAVTPLKSPV